MSSFLLKKKAYAGSFAFLFQFKEINCRIASNACGGLWRQCFIGNKCRDWFRRFNDDNFDLSDKKRENRPRKVKDCQLQTLLVLAGRGRYPIAKNVCRAIGCFSSYFHAATCHGVQKIGNWVLHELNDRQMERRQNTCQILLARQKIKSFLHRIVTGDEKWIYFQNPKRKKSWIDPAQPSTSSSRSNRFERKTMLCVW